MNENIDQTKILKDCPGGTKLYSTIYGEVKFISVEKFKGIYPIGLKNSRGDTFWLTQDGKYISSFDGECVLFPSKDQRDWSKFAAHRHNKEKFDPKILEPFDKVLVRSYNSTCWGVQLFSYIIEDEKDYPYLCTNGPHRYCIPYNDDTKHLLGTMDEAPYYYRYWED